MKLQDCNPFLRAAQLQHAVLEGTSLRKAYDHRIFYILKGEGTLFLERKEHPLHPDTLLFLRPGVGYYFKGKMRVGVLNFDLTRAEAHRPDAVMPPPAEEFDPQKQFDPAVLPTLPEVLIRPECQSLREEIIALIQTYRRKDPLSDARTSALLKKLLADLTADPQQTEASAVIVRRVERYIQLYATEIQSNQQIAEEFGYHPVYLSALFSRETGRSLHRAVLEERMKTACQFLRCTADSIDSIAEDTGFSSRSHFCTAFKAEFGCTPLQYRKDPR